MCLQVFVALDEPQPLAPFDAAAPAFNVSELWPKAEPVRRHFSKPHAYSLGSWMGCACGFRYDASDLDGGFMGDPNVPEEIKDSERADHESRRESVRQLRRFLTLAVSQSSSAELFSCWYGSEGAELVSRRVVTLDFFGGESFRFIEKELLTVRGGRTPED